MPHDEAKLVPWPAPLVEEPFDSCRPTELRARLTDAILHLPEHERLVFTLYYYEELKTEEIELLLGKTEFSVPQIHAAALENLRTRLADLPWPVIAEEFLHRQCDTDFEKHAAVN
jgi:RNA polymerase sigma factor (sigma-70 family)